MVDRPRNVKDLLVEAKDTSELMVDLAYAAVFFDEEELAEEELADELAGDEATPEGDAAVDDLPPEGPGRSADRADEGVLEETPEFLQETPEHDRLWFEQKPPRDFDFDG